MKSLEEIGLGIFNIKNVICEGPTLYRDIHICSLYLLKKKKSNGIER